MINLSVELSPRVLGLDKVLGPEDRRQMLGVIGQDMVTEIGEQFETQGRHFLGSQWQDLSEWRKAERRAKGTWPGKILQDTGALKRNTNLSVTSEVVTVGLLQQYASTHEFGEGRVPQRKILPRLDLAKTIATKSAVAYVDIVIKNV